MKSKLFLNWIVRFKILRVVVCPSAPDGEPVEENQLYLELPSRIQGVKAKTLVCVIRCKPRFDPQDYDDRPYYLQAGFKEHFLSIVSKKCPPFHATDIDVEPEVGIERSTVDPIVAHQFVRKMGEKLAVLHQTRWVGY